MTTSPAPGAYTHMTLLARTTTGMHNLFRMASLASLEGHYFKPRIDRELLSTYGDGLIATTGCPGGEVQTRLRLGQYREALAAASEFRDIFGAGNYYCELMDHGLPIEQNIRADLLRLAKELEPAAARHQRPALHPGRGRQGARGAAVRAVRLDAGRPQPVQVRRRRLLPDDRRADAAHLPRAARRPATTRCGSPSSARCPSSRARAATCRGSPARPGRTSSPGSSRRSSAGLHARYPGGVPDYARKQAAYETEVIVGKGYPGYFLVVADFINWAKDNGIRVGPGRGSGAGSMCAYAMRITDLDPVKNGLIFERFLNPERPSMPDFDVDFDERRRGEVIRYVTEKYGSERVAQIVTYGTIKAKQALKDSARVLGYPFAVGERLTKAMPPTVMGKDISLARDLRPAGQALQGGRRVPQAARHRRRGAGGRRDRPRAGGAEAAVGRPRGRRDHVQRAAGRPDPDHAPRAGRRRSSPSSTTRAARRSGWSRWTSWACAT